MLAWKWHEKWHERRSEMGKARKERRAAERAARQGQGGEFSSSIGAAPVAPERPETVGKPAYQEPKQGTGKPAYVEPDQGVTADDDSSGGDGVEPAEDPEGYVGPDGKAAPHEQPWEVREHYDDGLDRLSTVPLDEVEDREGTGGDVTTG